MKLQETLELLTVDVLKSCCTLIPNVKSGSRKADLVATLVGHLLSDDLTRTVARLSELEISAVAETVHCWNGHFHATGFVAKYGSLPKFFSANRLGRVDRSARQGAPSSLGLIFYQGVIPTDLAARLAALVEAPPPLRLATLTDDQLPREIKRERGAEPEPLRRVDTEPMMRQDLPAVLRLVAQGGLAVGAKTGVPSAAAVRRLEALLCGGDWYQAEDDKDLPRWAGGPIRPIRAFAWPLLLQTGGLAKIDGSRLALTAKGKKALSLPPHTVAADLHERWLNKGRPDELHRVDLIKGQTSKGVRLTSPNERREVILDALHGSAVTGQWLSVDEFFRWMKVHQHRFDVAGNAWKLYFNDAQYGSLGYGEGDFAVLEARYTLVYLFEYLATLGLIDVAYGLPYYARLDYHEYWGVDEFAFLSRYDGLRYLRLNDFGAFCLGLADHYSPRLPEREPLLRVETDLGLALLRAAEPAEQLQLEQIATAKTPDRWQLDAAAILNLSANGADEFSRIRDFLQASLEGDIPLELDDWLISLTERASALKDLGPARLIQCRDPALTNLLATDPATAKSCSRAGDRLLCVPDNKLAAFRKGLSRLGFVLPESCP